MKRFYVRFLFVFALILLVGGQGASAQDSTQHAYRDYIAALENTKGKAFRSILVDEITSYLRLFPEAEDADQMHFKKATIFWDRGQKVQAFFSHMQILYFYPQSDVVTVTRDRLRSLIVKEKKFKSLRDKTESLLNPAPGGTTLEGRHFQFIKDMVELKFEPAEAQLAASCHRFLEQFPQSEHSDQVRFWYAQILEQQDEPEKALTEYMKLTYLNSGSLLVTASKLKMAHVFTNDLKMHQKAVLTLEEFLLEYPDDPQAPQAQFQIASINAKRLKKYTEAINTFTDIAKKYPQSAEAVPALFEAAKIYETKFKEYDQAIRIYTEVVRDFPEDIKAPYAFAEAARIYEKKLDDPLNAANVYFKIYGNYPKSTIAAESLYAAAEINEKKLNDYEKAIMYYRFLVENYPQHKLAPKAQKRIDKLSKKLDTAGGDSE